MLAQRVRVFGPGLDGVLAQLKHGIHGGQNVLRRHITQDVMDSGKNKGLSLAAPQEERIDFVSRFVLENPELIKLWIDDFIAVGEIRDRYPFWDTLVEGIAARFAENMPDEPGDPEVYCVILLSSAIVGPRVFRNSVQPSADVDTIVKRFRTELRRLLRQDALLK